MKGWGIPELLPFCLKGRLSRQQYCSQISACTYVSNYCLYLFLPILKYSCHPEFRGFIGKYFFKISSKSQQLAKWFLASKNSDFKSFWLMALEMWNSNYWAFAVLVYRAVESLLRLDLFVRFWPCRSHSEPYNKMQSSFFYLYFALYHV